MKISEHYNSLLEALRSLYSKVASLELNKRLQSYRRDGGADIEIDIAGQLFDHVSRLASSQAAKPVVKAATPASHDAQPSADTGRPDASGPTDAVHEPSAEVGALSQHFDAGRSGSHLNPEMGGVLRKRTWEHIHAALRLARQGDAKNARLHVDLANAALAEAVHYMADNEIEEFVAEVKQKLEELTAQRR